jgi:hypothetical protein
MKVICVQNPKNKFAIKVGNKYDVISFEGGKYTIRNDKGLIWSFNQWFFKSESEILSEIRNDKLNLILNQK